MTFDELPRSMNRRLPRHSGRLSAIEEIKSGIALSAVVERLERGDVNGAVGCHADQTGGVLRARNCSAGGFQRWWHQRSR